MHTNLCRPLLVVLALGLFAETAHGSLAQRPNVIVIITDDQGYGDLGVHGNPMIRTPNLDQLAKESVRLKRFYVSPVCSPTRASLMTGRYNYRTCVVDTFLGRSLMHPEEVTLAERLARAGYHTGIFGKWHLGDNLPLRPIDRGFQQTLVLKGGGIGQPSDLPGGDHYFDPVLLRNGQPKRFSGYCSDVFTTAAIDFLDTAGTDPFFLYLAFNCPHDPLEAPEPELSRYRKQKLGADQFPSGGYPLPHELDQEKIARVYAMVSNIDSNVGRLLKAVAARGIAESTIVVFLTDNGPAFHRFNAGFRGLKGTTYEGGIHVPCYVRWPNRFPAGLVVDQIAAHIDIVPTLLDACAVPAGTDAKLDGRSLLPLLRGERAAAWPERTIYLQWHRGDQPELGRAFAARNQQFKLVRPETQAKETQPPMELYNLEQDPFEQHDLAEEHPELVARLYHDYLGWFRDVCGTRGFAPVPIQVGDPRESPTLLTRQDRRASNHGSDPAPEGFWELDVRGSGQYEIGLHVRKSKEPRTAHLRIQTRIVEQPVPVGSDVVVFSELPLTRGPAQLHAWVGGDNDQTQVLDARVRRNSNE